MVDGPQVRYRINARDEIISVDEGWRRFADSNDAAEFVDSDVIGHPLWDFITDETTRALYAKLIARARLGTPAQFTFRCDSPSARRLLEMSIASVGAGAVEFATSTLQLDFRSPSALLARDTLRSAEFIRACAWCSRIDIGIDEELWVDVEVATTQLGLMEGGPMPRMSHGICESCLKAIEHRLVTGAAV